MTIQLLLYTRKEDEIQKEFGNEVPVLFINGRKAFKYRVTARELAKRLEREDSVS